MKLVIVILILVIDLIHNKRIFWQHDGNKELMLSVIRELPDYLRHRKLMKVLENDGKWDRMAL